MDSPQHIGDTTANSISSQLYGTHLHRTTPGVATASAVPKHAPPKVCSAVYSGQKFLQLTVPLVAGDSARKGNGHTLSQSSVMVLRRVQDSYVNVSQMLQILVVLEHYTADQLGAFFRNEITSNTQYLPESSANSLPLFNDFSSHEVHQIRGLWIPFDKAISIAVKFDIYKLIKPLFLVDVHDFDKLPKSDSSVVAVSPPSPSKRVLADQGPDSFADSPTKKRKTTTNINGVQAPKLNFNILVSSNTNYPYTLPPLSFDDKHRGLIAEAKLVLNEIFKDAEKDNLSSEDVESRFHTIFEKCKAQGVPPSTILDVHLDNRGKTALHYAATLANEKLARSLIQLKICSPVRGDNKGESPLTATIQVTNAMQKGNFPDMLDAWLWPNLWLFDNKNQSFLHYLIQGASKNPKSSKFYLGKILEWVIASPQKKQHLDTLCNKVVNAQETQRGNTALHLAGENGLKWFVFLLLELDADVTLANNMGVRPNSFDCVNQVVDARKAFKNNPTSPATTAALLEALEADDDIDDYLVSLVHTGVEFWKKSIPFSHVGELEEQDDVVSKPNDKELTPTSEVSSSSLLSNKIFKSIQDLLSNTNEEYEKVIHSKKAEINNLNRELRDATIVTANNRLIAKNIASKMTQVDTMKLQMMNLNDKMQMLKRELGNVGDEDAFNPEWEVDTASLEKYDADEPFIIKGIYDKLVKGEEAQPTPDLIQSLPPSEVLRARLRAYEEVNSNLEKELENLVDYGELTAQFKKVVSSCTGVDINEVDELLDGLLEAVEGQQ
ncbi:hypothetical protein JCM33374_g3853 [Metschnikowia sp. JCM 33374]|nr:hypothetical protein JCM33374_g3853 [Metschnikowia sp. JCM 33374]